MEKSKKVQVIVFRKDEGKLFVLLLLTNNKSGAFWQNITGSVEDGEDYHEGAKRELLEETGIDSEVFEIGYEFSFHNQWNKDVTEKSFYTFTTKVDIELSEEHQAFKWLEVSKVTRNEYKFDTNFTALTKALNCLN